MTDERITEYIEALAGCVGRLHHIPAAKPMCTACEDGTHECPVSSELFKCECPCHHVH